MTNAICTNTAAAAAAVVVVTPTHPITTDYNTITYVVAALAISVAYHQ